MCVCASHTGVEYGGLKFSGPLERILEAFQLGIFVQIVNMLACTYMY